VTHGGWWVPLLLGICSIGAGMIAALVRGITTLVLVAIIGANAIITGVFDLIAATRLPRRLRNAWMLVLTGVLSVLFGIFVLLFPGAGAPALVWLIGVYALFTGALLFVLGITARAWHRDGLTGKPHAPLHPYPLAGDAVPAVPLAPRGRMDPRHLQCPASGLALAYLT
jgi:uncharacterized membrane protein HdeD (DUF308 family)